MDFSPTSRENFPSEEVVVRLELSSLTVTATPGKGLPRESSTVPFTKIV